MKEIPSIENAPIRLTQLKMTARQLFLSAPMTNPSSCQRFLEHSRYHIAVCLAHVVMSHFKSFSEKNRKMIQRLLVKICGSISERQNEKTRERLEELRLHLSQSQHAGLVSVLEPLLLPSWGFLTKRGTDIVEIISLGKAWMALGIARMELTVPPPSVDPAAKHNFKADHLSSVHCLDLTSEIKIRSQFQCIPGGFDETESIVHLKEKLKSIEMRIQSLKDQSVARPHPSQYPEIEQRVSKFMQTQGTQDSRALLFHLNPSFLGFKSKLNSLAMDLEQGNSEAIRNAENWIETALNFLKDQSNRFPFYIDILQPFLHGVLETCHGLSALQAAHRIQSVYNDLPNVSEYTRALMQLHSTFSLHPIGARQNLEDLGRHLHAKLSALHPNEVLSLLFVHKTFCSRAMA